MTCGGANRGGNRVSILPRYARFRPIRVKLSSRKWPSTIFSVIYIYIYIAIIIFLNFYHYLFIEKISHSVPFYSCIVRNIIFFEINCNYDPICLQMQRSGFELGPGICREWTRTGLQTHSGFESAVRRRRRKKARWRRRRRRRGKKEKEKGGKRGCALHTSRLHTVIYGATKIIAAVKIPRGVFIDRHALPPRDCSWNEAALETTRLRLSRL